MSRTFLLALVLLFSMLSIEAQSRTSNSYLFEKLSMERGLPSVFAYRIHQQSNGALWFSTTRGSVWFDGEKFRPFLTSAGKALEVSNMDVRATVTDRYGRLWLGTQGGLHRVGLDGQVREYREGRGLPSPWILSLLVDSQNRLWVGTGEGVALYDHRHDSFVTVEGTSGQRIMTMKEDHERRIWFGAKNSLMRFDEVNEEAQVFEYGNHDINELLFIEGGSLLIGTEKAGVIVWREDAGVVRTFDNNDGLSGLGNQEVQALAQVGREVWMAELGVGIVIWDLDTDKISHIKTDIDDKYGLSMNLIYDMLVDAQGQVWLAGEGGVIRVKSKGDVVRFYRRKVGGEGLSADFITSVTPLQGSKVAVASEFDVDVVDIESDVIVQKILDASGAYEGIDDRGYIWQVHNDGAYVWTASYRFVKRIDVVNGVFEVFGGDGYGGVELPNRGVFSVYGDGSGGAWLSGQREVSLRYVHPEKGVNNVIFDEGSLYRKTNNFANTIMIGADGIVWAATTNGVYEVDPIDGSYIHYKLGDEKSGIRATRVLEVADDSFWAATTGLGLMHIHGRTGEERQVAFYGEEHGLPSGEIDILQYIDGKLWGGSGRVLFEFDPVTKYVQVYPSVLPIKYASFQASGSSSLGSKLLAPTSVGLAVIDTAKLGISRYEPVVAISSVTYGNQKKIIMPKQPGSEEVEHFVADGDISVEFKALDYIDQGAVRYQYRWAGKSDAWFPIGSEEDLHFRNLPFGDYELEVRASNSDGVWSNNVGRLKFSVGFSSSDWSLIVLLLISLTLNVIMISIIKALRQRRKKENVVEAL